MTIIHFEHTSWLPFSFLVWELWDKREGYIKKQVKSRTGLGINKGHVEALHNIMLQGREKWIPGNSMSQHIPHND